MSALTWGSPLQDRFLVYGVADPAEPMATYVSGTITANEGDTLEAVTLRLWDVDRLSLLEEQALEVPLRATSLRVQQRMEGTILGATYLAEVVTQETIAAETTHQAYGVLAAAQTIHQVSIPPEPALVGAHVTLGGAPDDLTAVHYARGDMDGVRQSAWSDKVPSDWETSDATEFQDDFIRVTEGEWGGLLWANEDPGLSCGQGYGYLTLEGAGGAWRSAQATSIANTNPRRVQRIGYQMTFRIDALPLTGGSYAHVYFRHKASTTLEAHVSVADTGEVWLALKNDGRVVINTVPPDHLVPGQDYLLDFWYDQGTGECSMALDGASVTGRDDEPWSWETDHTLQVSFAHQNSANVDPVCSVDWVHVQDISTEAINFWDGFGRVGTWGEGGWSGSGNEVANGYGRLNGWAWHRVSALLLRQDVDFGQTVQRTIFRPESALGGGNLLLSHELWDGASSGYTCRYEFIGNGSVSLTIYRYNAGAATLWYSGGYHGAGWHAWGSDPTRTMSIMTKYQTDGWLAVFCNFADGNPSQWVAHYQDPLGSMQAWPAKESALVSNTTLGGGMWWVYSHLVEDLTAGHEPPGVQPGDPQSLLVRSRIAQRTPGRPAPEEGVGIDQVDVRVVS